MAFKVGVYVCLTVTSFRPQVPRSFTVPTCPCKQQAISVTEESLKQVETINRKKIIRCLNSAVFIDIEDGSDEIAFVGPIWFLLGYYTTPKGERLVNFVYTKSIYTFLTKQSTRYEQSMINDPSLGYEVMTLKSGVILRLKPLLLTCSHRITQLWNDIPKTAITLIQWRIVAMCMILCDLKTFMVLEELTFVPVPVVGNRETTIVETNLLKRKIKQNTQLLTFLAAETEELETQLQTLEASLQ